MYVVTQDVAVTITDVVVSADAETVTPEEPTVVTLAIGDSIDFETAEAIESFGGTDGSIVDGKLQTTKNADAADWAGNVIARGDYIYPLSGINTLMTADVYSTVPATIRMKLESSADGSQSAEVDSNVAHTGSGWETLVFDFIGTNAIDANFDVLVLFPNFGVVGAGNTYEFDNITFAGSQANDGPVDNANAVFTGAFGGDLLVKIITLHSHQVLKIGLVLQMIILPCILSVSVTEVVYRSLVQQGLVM